MRVLTLLLVFISLSATAQNVKYNIVNYGGGVFQLSREQQFGIGAKQVSYSDVVDSVGLVSMLTEMAKTSKVRTKDLTRILVHGTINDNDFNTVSNLLSEFNGTNFFSNNVVENPSSIFNNVPETDTVNTVYIEGSIYTKWTVIAASDTIFCKVNELGEFIETNPDFTTVENGKRGRFQMYDREFGRFIGAGTNPIINYYTDIIKVGSYKIDGVYKELWSSADRNIKLYKNI